MVLTCAPLSAPPVTEPVPRASTSNQAHDSGIRTSVRYRPITAVASSCRQRTFEAALPSVCRAKILSVLAKVQRRQSDVLMCDNAQTGFHSNCSFVTLTSVAGDGWGDPLHPDLLTIGGVGLPIHLLRRAALASLLSITSALSSKKRRHRARKFALCARTDGAFGVADISGCCTCSVSEDKKGSQCNEEWSD